MQNRVLRSTAVWTLALGIILAVQAASTAPHLATPMDLVQIGTISAVVNGAMATMFLLTSVALRKVVSTRRQDTTQLMKALSDFSNVLQLRSILFLSAMGLMGVFMALMVFLSPSTSPWTSGVIFLRRSPSATAPMTR